MKNRTIIGIICMVLAVAITFLAAPLVTRMTSDTLEVPRLKHDVQRGVKITGEWIETVSVTKDSIPKGALTDSKSIIGKYAASNLFAGDYLTNDKLSAKANTAEDVIYSLDGDKYAMSFTIDSFAAGLSGKIKNGDIISLVVKDKVSGRAILPGAFKYVKVITTTTSGGVDQDKVIKNEDGTFTPPSTVTLLVNEAQAKLLADYEEGVISCVLVYRGSEEVAAQFLKVQDEYFETVTDESIENPAANEIPEGNIHE